MDYEKPRITRLAEIVTLLQSKQLLTAREIAEKYQVSIRTVYRDIRTLGDSGIPILTIEGKGYSLMQGYNLPPVMFTEKETNALITAEQLIQKNKDNSLSIEFGNAISKLKAVMRSSQKEKTEMLSERIVFRTPKNESPNSEYLMNIQSAITDFRLIELTYLSLDKKTTKRMVEPFAIYSTQNNWLLIAFCRIRNDFRAFRLDRIQKLIQQNEIFEPHQMTLQEYFKICEEKTRNIQEMNKNK